MNDKDIDAILDLAIAKEEEAYAFYRKLESQVNDDAIKETMAFLAGEEEKHKAFLSDYKNGKYGTIQFRTTDVTDYKIAEHFETPDAVTKNEDAYLLAAHRELESYKFYTALADIHPEGEVKSILLQIASEELKHKEKVEYLYSNAAFLQTDGG